MTASTTGYVEFEVIAGPHRGQKVSYSGYGSLIVGRSRRAQLTLKDDPFFSRSHFRIEFNPPYCFLQDLNSRNGTRVNGKRVSEVELRDGDIISGGDTQIRCVIRSNTGGTTGASGTDDTGAFTPKPSESILETAWEDGPGATLPLPSPLTPRIPGYVLNEEIGRGGMGVIYHAMHIDTGRECAVKMLVTEQRGNEQGLQLFIREASILRSLKHPRIVRVYETGMAEDTLFMAMEFVDTISHDEAIPRVDGKTRWHVCCAVVCELLEALEYAHARGIVHRDIKPSNLLMSIRNRKLHVKLADFGVAKSYLDSGLSGVTTTQNLRGTALYCAPEQILDSRSSKPSTDLYASTVTLYRLLTGVHPYESASVAEVIRRKLDEPPDPILAHRDDLPQGLVELIDRGLAREPEDRYLTAREMRMHLADFAKKPGGQASRGRG